jgi:sugar lactone lactonase YvrE
MDSSPSSSNSDKTFTLDPSDNLTGGTTYLTRVTTGVKDDAGNTMSSQYDNSTGFTTTSSSTQMGGSIQGTELDLSTAVTTLAGSTSGTFNSPRAITTDGTNLYVADSNNNRIRKIVISTGAVTTLASIAGNPQGITTDGTNLYVTTYLGDIIKKIVISTEVVTTLAGSTGGYLDHNTGTSAKFGGPIGITTDGTNLYVAEYGNHKIRKIVISTGVVTTLAGSSSSGSTDHNTGTLASFYKPYGITTDGTNLYVADSHNHRIRKIVIDNGTVTTLAGTGSVCSSNCDGTGILASFKYPRGITTDGTNLYVSNTNNHRIRKIVIDNGTVTTLAGSTVGYADNATGTLASFDDPRGITTDGTNLYVADSNNNRIRKIE